MRLTELEPCFVRYETHIDTWRTAEGEVTGPREHTILRLVDAAGLYTGRIYFADAQGIHFLCPVCFAKNGGAVGTHWCDVTFEGRGATPSQGSHGTDDAPTRWNVTGDSFENLSTTPSILLIGGCAWHGFITNGEVT